MQIKIQLRQNNSLCLTIFTRFFQTLIATISIITASILYFSCGSNNTLKEELERIENLCDSNPRLAIKYLKGIEPSRLSQEERNYFYFIQIKARDKAYIHHNNDSLIRMIEEYYSKQTDSHIYPEVLYYCGRVYSDIGDSPRALLYFHKSLEKMSTGVLKNEELEARVNSQIGRKLNQLRLYGEAIPYLTKAIELHKRGCNKKFIIYDTQLLATLYLNIEDYTRADSLFSITLSLSKGVSTSLYATQQAYLAALMLKQNQVETAREIIKNVPQKIEDNFKYTAYAIACDIYLNSGDIDSVLKYSKLIIQNPHSSNLKNGYQSILDKRVIKKLHPDTVTYYIEEYGKAMEEFIRKNGDEQSLIQNSLYNYNIADKEKQFAEYRSHRLQSALSLCLIIILFLIILFLIYKTIQKTKILKLYKKINELEKIHKQLTAEFTNEDGDDSVIIQETDFKETYKTAFPNVKMEACSKEHSELKIRLRNELSSLLQIKATQIPLEILNSQVLQELHDIIRENRCISENNPVWEKFTNFMEEVFPLFKERVYLLNGEFLNDMNYRILLLLKSGFTPTQIATLLNKSKGTISYRRNRMIKDMFGPEISYQDFDAMIKLL